ncbi:MAG: alpha/beta hydrolase, partial [Halioglobus sp.]|nr:alpha/beta hydrolase [Halioglobus sp.]
HVQDERVIAFLLASLRRNAAGFYVWRFDRDGIECAYTALSEAPVKGRPFTGPVLFIKGADSAYIQASQGAVITELFPAAVMKVMPGCGHWLHAEQPQIFNRIVTRFLRSGQLT